MGGEDEQSGELTVLAQRLQDKQAKRSGGKMGETLSERTEQLDKLVAEINTEMGEHILSKFEYKSDQLVHVSKVLWRGVVCVEHREQISKRTVVSRVIMSLTRQQEFLARHIPGLKAMQGIKK